MPCAAIYDGVGIQLTQMPLWHDTLSVYGGGATRARGGGRPGAGRGRRGRVLLLLFALDGKPLSKHAIPVEQCALGRSLRNQVVEAFS